MLQKALWKFQLFKNGEIFKIQCVDQSYCKVWEVGHFWILFLKLYLYNVLCRQNNCFNNYLLFHRAKYLMNINDNTILFPLNMNMQLYSVYEVTELSSSNQKYLYKTT